MFPIVLVSARPRPLTAAFLFYAARALAFFHALLPRIAAALQHDPGDPVRSAWILWWNAHPLPFTGAWWDGRAF